jgi:sigma-B regulation protein RsbU (phosphoserine phosphatase)
LIKTYFELAGQSRLRPEEFAFHLNDALCRLTPPGIFATIVYCVYDVQTRELRYLNGGHSPLPILVLPDGQTAPISSESNMLLGAIEIDDFQEERFTMPPGAKLLLATDGLVDALSPEGEQFGYDRLTGTVRQKAKSSARELDKAVFDELSCFTQQAGQSDDIAALVLEFQ